MPECLYVGKHSLTKKAKCVGKRNQKISFCSTGLFYAGHVSKLARQGSLLNWNCASIISWFPKEIYGLDFFQAHGLPLQFPGHYVLVSKQLLKLNNTNPPLFPPTKNHADFHCPPKKANPCFFLRWLISNTFGIIFLMHLCGLLASQVCWQPVMANTPLSRIPAHFSWLDLSQMSRGGLHIIDTCICEGWWQRNFSIKLPTHSSN